MMVFVNEPLFFDNSFAVAFRSFVFATAVFRFFLVEFTG